MINMFFFTSNKSATTKNFKNFKFARKETMGKNGSKYGLKNVQNNKEIY